MLLIILSLQIGAYSANKEIKHLIFSCEIFSFLFFFFSNNEFSCESEKRQQTPQLTLPCEQAHLCKFEKFFSGREENRPRKGDPARKLLIFDNPLSLTKAG